MLSCKIVIIEDDRYFAEHLRLQLLQYGYEVVGSFASAEAALAQFDVLAADLVLMDIILEGSMDGIEAAQIVQQQYRTPVLFLTAFSDESFISRAKLTAPFAYILKPFNEQELKLTIEIALTKNTIMQHSCSITILTSRKRNASARWVAMNGHSALITSNAHQRFTLSSASIRITLAPVQKPF
ncbi:MAG: response regulator [Gammaproteobacteria bacterium]|nr:response regulator [Gammaproteobacteria bacterium]